MEARSRKMVISQSQSSQKGERMEGLTDVDED